MKTMEILSPTVPGPAGHRALAPCLATLQGKRLGIRRDRTWHSFETFTDEFARLARKRIPGVEIVFFDPEARIGSPEQESARVEQFSQEVDAALVGLGT